MGSNIAGGQYTKWLPAQSATAQCAKWPPATKCTRHEAGEQSWCQLLIIFNVQRAGALLLCRKAEASGLARPVEEKTHCGLTAAFQDL